MLRSIDGAALVGDLHAVRALVAAAIRTLEVPAAPCPNCEHLEDLLSAHEGQQDDNDRLREELDRLGEGNAVRKREGGVS